MRMMVAAIDTAITALNGTRRRFSRRNSRQPGIPLSDRGMPGWRLFRRLNRRRVPFNAVIAVSIAATIILIPAYWGNSVGVAWAYGAVTGICTVGLYIAYILPVYLRFRAG